MCLSRSRQRIYCSNSQTDISLPTAKKCLASIPDTPTKFSVISACLLNIEKGRAIELPSITEEGAANGVYSVKSKRGMYKVQIQEGNCSCPYFTQSRIPCKHMFSIFQNFRRRWEDLPHSLTEGPFMTLDSDIYCRMSIQIYLLQKRTTQFHNTCTSIPIPLHQTPGSRLLHLQKQLRDELAKCSAAVFMVDDITTLENVQSKVHSIHSELLLTSSTKHADDREQPIQEAEAEEQQRMPNTTQTTKAKDDPLNAATRPSVGRPKRKKATTNRGTGIESPHL